MAPEEGSKHPEAINHADKEEMSLDDAIDLLGFGAFQWKLLFIAGFCWMCESMEMMLLSVISPVIKCQWDLHDSVLATVTTVVFLGMMIGAVTWGAVSDTYGRRFGFLATSLITFVFGFASSFSPDVYTLIVIRGFVGFGVGGGHVAFTLFAEYLPRKNRALCLVLIELFWTLGTVGEAALAWILLPHYHWRWLFIMSSLPLLGLCLMYWAVPESIRFLLTKGRQQDAMTALRAVAHGNGKALPCQCLIMPDMAKKVTFKDLLMPTLRKTTILLWIIWFANAFVYYGIVLAATMMAQQQQEGARCLPGKIFAPFFRQPIHHSSSDVPVPTHCGMDNAGYEAVFITSLAELPGIVITVLVIDHLGRKLTQGMEFLVVGVLCLVVTMCMPSWLQLICLFVIRGLITGAFQASYVYTPEVYPTTVRSTGLGVCSTMARVGGMLTPYVAQVLLQRSDYLALGTYALAAFAAAVSSFGLPIETSGKDMPDTLDHYDADRLVFHKKTDEEKGLLAVSASSSSVKHDYAAMKLSNGLDPPSRPETL